MIIVINGVARPTDIPCKYLRFKRDGTTCCSVYKSRVGRDLGYGNKCGLRKDTIFDYEGCPYNTNKPLVKHIK